MIRILILTLGYAFLYIPLLFLIIFSFNDGQYPGIWLGFSLQWYDALLHNNAFLVTTINSVKIAILSATLSTVLGTMAAIIYAKFDPFRTRQLIGHAFLLPLGTPDVVTGFSIVLVLKILENLLGWPQHFGYLTITIAHTTIALSYVYSIVEMRLREFDTSLTEAALDLGATPFRAFFSITLPIISPAVLSGWLLAFALSFDDVTLASFLSGPGSSTLPMLILSQIRTGITPEINALSALIIFTVSVAVIISSYFMYRKR